MLATWVVWSNEQAGVGAAGERVQLGDVEASRIQVQKWAVHIPSMSSNFPVRMVSGKTTPNVFASTKQKEEKTT